MYRVRENNDEPLRIAQGPMPSRDTEKTMRKVLKFLALGGTTLVALSGARPATAATACPSECRDRWGDVVCSRVETTRDDRVSVTYLFWTNGAENGVN